MFHPSLALLLVSFAFTVVHSGAIMWAGVCVTWGLYVTEQLMQWITNDHTNSLNLWLYFFLSNECDMHLFWLFWFSWSGPLAANPGCLPLFSVYEPESDPNSVLPAGALEQEFSSDDFFVIQACHFHLLRYVPTRTMDCANEPVCMLFQNKDEFGLVPLGLAIIPTAFPTSHSEKKGASHRQRHLCFHITPLGVVK